MQKLNTLEKWNINWNVNRFSMLDISQVILVQPCTNSMWGDESEGVAPIIWLYQTVDAQKEEDFYH